MPKLNGVGGEPQVWLDTSKNQAYLVYFVPDTDPPVPLLYSISEKELQAAFGPGKKIKYDRQLDNKALRSVGAMEWGDRSELDNDTEDPFDAWSTIVADAAAVRPWLQDDEVLALYAEALLEGREVSQAEMEQTEWWRSHNARERQWMLLSVSDPSTADQQMREQEVLVRNLMVNAGIRNPSIALVRDISRRFITGQWGEAYTQAQIRALADPYSGIRLDPDLAKYRDGTDQTRGEENTVKELVTRWLGPRFGNWSEQKIAAWAGRLRNDPDAAVELEELLSRQRLALYPAYDNPNLTYEDISGPWAAEWQRTWGQLPDEMDPLFTQIVRMNDLVGAGKVLRREGLKRNVGKVVGDVVEGIGSTAIGEQVRTVTR